MYGRRKAILRALNFTVPAGEGAGAAGGGAPTGAAAAGVAPDSAAGQALDAQAAAAAAGAAGGETKPPGYVPVGELAQERQKRHAAETAAAAAQTASAQQIEALKKALGLSEGQTPEQLAAAALQAQSTAAEATAQLSVFKLARAAGGDAEALLDSRTFLNALSKIDASNDEAVTNAIKAAVEGNKKLGLQKVAPAGSQDAGQGSGAGSQKPSMNELMRAAAGKA